MKMILIITVTNFEDKIAPAELAAGGQNRK